MEPELLELPLGVKIPVVPGSKPVFSRAKLGEKLHRPSGHFDLGDPYCRHTSTEYNSLHDPHLREYYKRKDNMRRLKKGGYITSDGKVVCTLKEFNEYRQYLTRLKLEAEKTARQEKERLRPHMAKSKDARKAPGESDASCWRQQPLQPRKASCPPPHKSRKSSPNSGPCRGVKAAMDKGQTCCHPELGQQGAKLPRRVSGGADCKRKPDVGAGSVFRAAFHQGTAPAVQKLEEAVETVVHQVLELVKGPWAQSMYVLRRVALGMRRRLCGGTGRAETSPLERWEEIVLLGQELVVTVLEDVEEHLASSRSKACGPGPAAGCKEQPVARGTTRAGKSKEEKAGQAERAASHRAPSEACLDAFARRVVNHVCRSLECFVASLFEGDFSRSYSDIMELLGESRSNRRPQPFQTPFSRQGTGAAQGLPRASARRSLEASKEAKRPALQPLPSTRAADVSRLSRRAARESTPNAVCRDEQRRAGHAAYGRATVPEVLGRAGESSERERKPKPRDFTQTLALRTMASWIVGCVLEADLSAWARAEP